jgi:hypothetical protein
MYRIKTIWSGLNISKSGTKGQMFEMHETDQSSGIDNVFFEGQAATLDCVAQGFGEDNATH